MLRLLAAALCIGSLACASPPLESQSWLELQSRHFRITSQASPEITLRIARQLEVFRRAVVQFTGARPVSGVRPSVYLFGDYDSYEPFEVKLWVDGYYLSGMDGGAVVINTEASDGRTIDLVNHELVHFLLRGSGDGRTPLWYNEGFAEVLSTARPEGGQLVFGAPPSHAVAALLDLPPVPLGELLQQTDLRGWFGPSRQAFYAHAWALVHMLRLGHGSGGIDRNAALDRYLALVADGRPPLAAVQDAFGVSVDALEVELDDYIFRAAFPTTAIPAPRLPADAVPDPVSLAPAEALVRLAQLSASLGDEKRLGLARSYLERAVVLAPDSARAQAWLALHEVPDGEPAEVLARFDRAGVLAPDDPVVATLFGRYELKLASGAAAVGDHTVMRHWADRAREHFRESIALDGSAPEAHYYRGLVSLVDGRRLRAGVRSLERARRRAPWSAEIALRLGQAYARSGRLDAARRELRAIARWPDAQGHAEWARELLERIDARAASQPSAGPPDP